MRMVSAMVVMMMVMLMRLMTVMHVRRRRIQSHGWANDSLMRRCGHHLMRRRHGVLYPNRFFTAICLHFFSY